MTPSDKSLVEKATNEYELTSGKAYSQLVKLYMEAKNKAALKERSDVIDLLEKYSLFLEKNGYLDTDWRSEEPFAIDEFLKERFKAQNQIG